MVCLPIRSRPLSNSATDWGPRAANVFDSDRLTCLSSLRPPLWTFPPDRSGGNGGASKWSNGHIFQGTDLFTPLGKQVVEVFESASSLIDSAKNNHLIDVDYKDAAS